MTTATNQAGIGQRTWPEGATVSSRKRIDAGEGS